VGAIAGCGTGSNKLDDFGTVRGRLGYVWNNMMLYGTGGWAWGRFESTLTGSCSAAPGAACPGSGVPFASGSLASSTTVGGWAAGAGGEWQVLPHWTLRVEYLHLQFNSINSNSSTTGTTTLPGLGTIPVAITASAGSKAGIDTVRFGVNYLFN
jgi:outer membrane immunogenic protein